MSKGIAIFGANGCGKTTLGRELAKRLNIKHLDVEDYYFEKSEIPYTKPRSKDKVIELMLEDIKTTDFFVISGVTCDFGNEISSMYKLAVLVSVPNKIRFERVEHRSFEKFGERVLIGGDMYEQEKDFLEFVKTRNIAFIDEWVKSLTCPVLYLDGTKTISDNTCVIIEKCNLAR